MYTAPYGRLRRTAVSVPRPLIFAPVARAAHRHMDHDCKRYLPQGTIDCYFFMMYCLQVRGTNPTVMLDDRKFAMLTTALPSSTDAGVAIRRRKGQRRVRFLLLRICRVNTERGVQSWLGEASGRDVISRHGRPTFCPKENTAMMLAPVFCWTPFLSYLPLKAKFLQKAHPYMRST